MIKIAGLFIAWFALWLGIAGTFVPEPQRPDAAIKPNQMKLHIPTGLFEAQSYSAPTFTEPAIVGPPKVKTKATLYMPAGAGTDGKVHMIQVDEDGYVICSKKKKGWW